MLVRSTVMLTVNQVAGLREAVKHDTAGRTVAHFLRQFVAEGLTRLKRQQAQQK